MPVSSSQLIQLLSYAWQWSPVTSMSQSQTCLNPLFGSIAHHSRRFMDPSGSWMIPEDHPSVGSVREEQSRVSSWAMTEHSHPSSSRSPSPRHSHAHRMEMSLPYMISQREAFLPSIFPGRSSSCSSSTCRHQLLSISGLRHGWKGSLKPSAISLLLPTCPDPLPHLQWPITALMGPALQKRP